jgi:hypothetical protein
MNLNSGFVKTQSPISSPINLFADVFPKPTPSARWRPRRLVREPTRDLIFLNLKFAVRVCGLRRFVVAAMRLLRRFAVFVRLRKISVIGGKLFPRRIRGCGWCVGNRGLGMRIDRAQRQRGRCKNDDLRSESDVPDFWFRPTAHRLNCFTHSLAAADKVRISELPGPFGPTAVRLKRKNPFADETRLDRPSCPR